MKTENRSCAFSSWAMLNMLGMKFAVFLFAVSGASHFIFFARKITLFHYL